MVEPELLSQLQKRFKEARKDADLWESVLEASYHYAVPFRNRFYRPKQFQGELRNNRLYDTTAVEATKTFVSKLHTAMTPPQVQWGFLSVDEEEFEGASTTDIQEAQLALDTYMRRLFKHLHRSNFDVIINECYFDLAIGTSCLIINQHTDKEPLMFTSIPADKLAIAEGLDGKVHTWFRTWDDIKISELTTRWKKAVPSAEMMQSVIENVDAKITLTYEGVLYTPNAKLPYVYAVWTDDHLLFAEELESNPGIVWRFQKTNNEVWGRGPVMEALPSIISLQEIARIELASANLNTFKPYMGFSDGVFNPYTFKLEPFTVIPIAPIGAGGQYPLTPLPDSSSPQFSQLVTADLRMQIKTLMFATDVTDTGSVQPQTATEVQVNQQNLAQKIGPLFSRLQSEFLEPVIQRCAFILDKMGILPKPMINGKEVSFVYKSPLALASGQQDIARFTQYVQLLQGITGPEATQMIVNVSEAPWVMADMLQVDPRFLNTPEQVAAEAQKQLASQEIAQAEGNVEGEPTG